MDPVQLMREHGLSVASIVHVGANTGQEAACYARSGADPCIYVEAISSVFEQLERNVARYPGHVALRALCLDTDGEEVELKVASNAGQSSSVLELGEHALIYPDIRYVGSERMRSVRLDTLLGAVSEDVEFSLLVLDTQGTELKVLQGAPRTLAGVAAVFTEVSDIPLYKGSCTMREVQDHLEAAGFRMKWLAIGPQGWGDAFFLRSAPVEEPLPVPGPNLASGRPAAQSSTSQWSRPGEALDLAAGGTTRPFAFHTDIEEQPWWQVDLLDVVEIGEIRIRNRRDGWQERACGLRVLVSLDGAAWHTVHDRRGRSFGARNSRVQTLRVFPGRSARYVRLQLAGRNYLHLASVEIYGAGSGSVPGEHGGA